MLAMSGESQGGCRLWDCMFGAAPSSQTTYAPPYTPAPVYSAPACQPTCVPVAAPSCSPCETYVPCATPCMPQACEYRTYRPYYSPAVVTAYQPVVGAYPLTTYRPFLGTYETRLVPYTTYRPYYAPAITYGYSPCPSCAPCGGCNSCAPCGSGGCGSVTYGAPASGCSSCNASSTVTSTPVVESSASSPSTFRQTNKPATKDEPTRNDDIQPTPDPEARPSSTSPALPDPNDRTASRATTPSARVQLIARPVLAAPVEEDSRWHPAKD